MSQKLKKIRKSKKLTVGDMSNKLCISAPFYNQLENRKRRLTYEMAVKIANVFKTKPDNLFYDEYKDILEVKSKNLK